MIGDEDIKRMMDDMQIPLTKIENTPNSQVLLNYDSGTLKISDRARSDLDSQELQFALALTYRYGKVTVSPEMGKSLGHHAAAIAIGSALLLLLATSLPKTPALVPILVMALLLVVISWWNAIRSLFDQAESRLLESFNFAIGRTANKAAGLSYMRKASKLIVSNPDRPSLIDRALLQMRYRMVNKLEQACLNI